DRRRPGRYAEGRQGLRTDNHAYSGRDLFQDPAPGRQAAAGDGPGPVPRGQPADGTGGAQGAGVAARSKELDGPHGRDVRRSYRWGGRGGVSDGFHILAAGRGRAYARGVVGRQGGHGRTGGGAGRPPANGARHVRDREDRGDGRSKGGCRHSLGHLLSQGRGGSLQEQDAEPVRGFHPHDLENVGRATLHTRERVARGQADLPETAPPHLRGHLRAGRGHSRDPHARAPRAVLRGLRAGPAQGTFGGGASRQWQTRPPAEV
ncbi:MAG: Predicted transcriptional regulator of N-Acetylglucosamine utilization, GntR family, partial [uncultured Rubrobacteraceae bacterium]